MNPKISNTARSGFTIVELVVVIVVIAVLASITLVSYRYLQTRAADTATVANVKQYVDALEMYAFEHGRYPMSESCLGKKPIGSDGCGLYEIKGCTDLGLPDTTSAGDYVYDPAFDAALSKYMGEQPNEVQPVSYKTVTTLAEGCTYSATAEQPVYTSAEWVMIYNNNENIAWSHSGESGKAYTIQYKIGNDAKCGLDMSINIYGVCYAYGGEIDKRD